MESFGSGALERVHPHGSGPLTCYFDPEETDGRRVLETHGEIKMSCFGTVFRTHRLLRVQSVDFFMGR